MIYRYKIFHLNNMYLFRNSFNNFIKYIPGLLIILFECVISYLTIVALILLCLALLQFFCSCFWIIQIKKTFFHTLKILSEFVLNSFLASNILCDNNKLNSRWRNIYKEGLSLIFYEVLNNKITSLTKFLFRNFYIFAILIPLSSVYHILWQTLWIINL